MSSKEIEEYVTALKTKRTLTPSEEKDLKKQRRYIIHYYIIRGTIVSTYCLRGIVLLASSNLPSVFSPFFLSSFPPSLLSLPVTFLIPFSHPKII